jgi:PHS family inorganic phosphate transporter-like MFS transporter
MGAGGGISLDLFLHSNRPWAPLTPTDYPIPLKLSAGYSIIARLIIFLFCFNVLGRLACGIVHAVLLAAFKSSVKANTNHLEWLWRLLLGLGIL